MSAKQLILLLLNICFQVFFNSQNIQYDKSSPLIDQLDTHMRSKHKPYKHIEWVHTDPPPQQDGPQVEYNNLKWVEKKF